jgi:ribosomal protein S12 methylthiotransferase
MKTFYFLSLGCPKNRVDTEVAVAGMIAAGYRPVETPEEADVLVVNTCSFVLDARSESVQALVELAEVKRVRPGARLVAMGCMGQQSGHDLARELPEVDLVLGTGAPDSLPALLDGPERVHETSATYLPDTAVPRVLTQSPAFAYLKVADGCSRHCAFCTIPSIKGPFQSRPLPALVDEARMLADQGVREIVLVAQDLTQFGLPGRRNLLRLLDALERVDRISWIRLMYLYPEGIQDGLIERVSGGGKVVPYLDMPLQHVDDRVLRAMRRGTSERSIRRIIERIRTAPRHIALRTTLITGHPGEDEDAFRNLESFVRETRFDHLGVFSWSPEEGTPSAELPGRLPAPLRRKRRAGLMKIQKRISTEINRGLVGSIQEVLVEGPSPEHPWVMQGRSSRQAPEVDGVVLFDGIDCQPGDLLEVRVRKATAYDLVAGVVVQER